jgi:hypothetical protein
MLSGSVRFAALWGKWLWRRRARRPAAPLLRLAVAPRSLGPAWHPAKAADGTPMLHVVLELEGRNLTDRDIRIADVRLRDHAVERANVTVGPIGEGPASRDAMVPARGRARIAIMFLLRAPVLRPGEAFADLLLVGDRDGRDHPLKVIVRGR